MIFNVTKDTIELGERVSLEDMIAVARYGAEVRFSGKYCDRVKKSRRTVEKWADEGQVMYGITTGFGSLCNKVICKEDTAKLQHNIINSHSTSVGAPFTEEECRGVMFMILQNLGQGFSGVRLDILEQYRQFLNLGITPWAPKEGSVGYLSPEAHMARVIEGSGRAYYKGELLDGNEALSRAGLKPVALASKEGLALISGTTSSTALAGIALYNMLNATAAADAIGAMSFEASKGQLNCIDERVMSVRPHKTQKETADNMRCMLADSEMLAQCQGEHLQDPLSLRCIPQLHGAVKKTLYDTLETIEIEMNSCCDNPIVWSEDDSEAVLSACNADSSYIGIEMDSAAIAATDIAKMSERRNNHLINGRLSGYPDFMIKNPGLNSGVMIPQYTQAGLLNDMRTLSTPASIDNTPTCCDQEDYVSMGYNASKKAITVAEKLEYILAIELLSSYESSAYTNTKVRRSPATEAVFEKVSEAIPLIENDIFLFDGINYLKELIHSGELVEIIRDKVPEFK